MGVTVLLFKRRAADIKKSKPFHVLDIAVYLAVLILAAAIFFALIPFKNTGEIAGFNFYFNNELVAEYSFNGGEFTVKSGFEENFSLESDGSIIFYADADKTAYNVIIIDEEAKTATVKEANCTGRDCTTQTAMQGGGFIFCAPHNLKITAKALSGPTTG